MTEHLLLVDIFITRKLELLRLYFLFVNNSSGGRDKKHFITDVKQNFMKQLFIDIKTLKLKIVLKK